MFTGLIQGLGAAEDIEDFDGQRRIGIRPLFKWGSLKDGESIAVNGVCLSVERHTGDKFYAYASRETLARTALGLAREGDRLNLERALEFGERVGGHLVTGHVDCVAEVEAVGGAGESRFFRCSFPPRFAPEVLEKGSVALDGVSLTVNASGAGYLEINVIPDSLKRTNISSWRPGTKINMETDLLGKYVLNSLRYAREGQAARPGVTRDFLADNGFI